MLPRPLALLPFLLPLACAPSSQPATPIPGLRIDPSAATPAFTSPAARSDALARALPQLDAHFRDPSTRGSSPALAVAVVVDDHIAWSAAYGLADVARHVEATPRSVFRLYSITKTVTATAVMQLRDAGRLSLDEPAAKYVPELAKVAYPYDDAAPITIRALLSHNAGLPHFGAVRPADPAHGLTEAEIVAGLEGLPLAGPPAVEYRYSSLGYSILGVVVHRVSGVPYKQYVAEHVLGPLGMRSATFDPATVPRGDLAIGYEDVPGKGIVVARDPGFGDDAPEGGLLVSIEDLARYAAFQLAAWPPRSGPDSTVLRRSSVREMHHAASLDQLDVWRVRGEDGVRARGQADAFGLGWGLSVTCDDALVLQHTGGDFGFHSDVLLLPESGIGVVTLSNLGHEEGRPARQAIRILRRAGALARRTLPPSPSFVDARARVASLLEHWDDGVAASTLRPRQLPAIADTHEAFARLHAAHGVCKLDGAIEMTAPLAGKWRATCERGFIDFRGVLVSGTAALENLDYDGTFAPSEAMTRAASRVVALVGAWTPEGAAAAFASDAAAATFKAGVVDLARCSLGEVKGGDGAKRSTFALACGGQSLEIEVELDEGSDKAKSAAVSDPEDGRRCPR